MGRLDEARAIVTKLRAITPLLVPNDLAFRNPRTASSTCRACAWRQAKQVEPELPLRHFSLKSPRLSDHLRLPSSSTLSRGLYESAKTV